MRGRQGVCVCVCVCVCRCVRTLPMVSLTSTEVCSHDSEGKLHAVPTTNSHRASNLRTRRK
jgi:hypothetical protein